MTEAFVKYPTGGKHIAKIENINRLTVLVKTLLSVRHRQQNIEIQTGNNNNKKKNPSSIREMRADLNCHCPTADYSCLDNRGGEREPGAACWFLCSRTRQAPYR